MELDFSEIQKSISTFQNKVNRVKNIFESHKLTFDEGIKYLFDIRKLFDTLRKEYTLLSSLFSRLVKNKDLKPKPTKSKNLINNFLTADRELINAINIFPSLLKDIDLFDDCEELLSSVIFHSTPSFENNELKYYDCLSFTRSHYTLRLHDKKIQYDRSRSSSRSGFSIFDLYNTLKVRNIIYGSIKKNIHRLPIHNIEKPIIEDKFYYNKREYDGEIDDKEIDEDEIKEFMENPKGCPAFKNFGVSSCVQAFLKS